MIPLNKKKDPVKFALVGCGRISQAHLESLASLNECVLKGVVDVRESAANSVAEQFSCRAYTDYRQVLDTDDIDAVIISTPPKTHAEIALFFLENGIHVLCEKPLAMNTQEAVSMVQKADEKDCLLMMASKFRYVDDVIKAKGIIESGILGDIVLFENFFCSKVDMRNRWNANNEVSGGGVLIDNGSHSVDIARFLLGPIVKVQAEEGKRIQKLDVEDTALMQFVTTSNVLGTIKLSWSFEKEREYYINVFGTEGVLSIGWKRSRYRQSEKLDWLKFGGGYNKFTAFTAQIRNFVASIQGREAPLITAVDSMESVRVVEAAYKSMGNNSWVEIK